jgi:hypothetical protein
VHIGSNRLNGDGRPETLIRNALQMSKKALTEADIRAKLKAQFMEALDR